MKLRVVIFALSAFLLSASTALAGTGSAGQTYGGSAGVVQSQVQSSSSNLPFTGLDVALLVVGGVLLVLLGVALRLFARPRPHA
jgi:hypothetical protein